MEIFKRTGSITKLQKAMGHSSINVSLNLFKRFRNSRIERRRYAYGLVINKVNLIINS